MDPHEVTFDQEDESAVIGELKEAVEKAARQAVGDGLHPAVMMRQVSLTAASVYEEVYDG